jgi:hypothetical protein
LCSPDTTSTGLIWKSSTFFSNRAAKTREVQVENATPTIVNPMATDNRSMSRK